MLLEEKIAKIVSEPLEARGYDLAAVSISFSSNHSKKGCSASTAVLDISIDRLDSAPVSVDDCTKASHIISALLDVENPIESRYFLNVSSPGEYRPVRNPEKNLPRFCGQEVTIEMDPDSDSATKIGRKKVTGILEKCDEKVVTISSVSTSENNYSEILLSDIKKATVHRIFKI